VELKGESARNLWQQLHDELLRTEQLGTSRGATLHTFSKGTIRALLPIRDCSRWIGKKLPTKWAQVAKEPTTWATLFDDDPITVKPRERKVSSFLKSYRYASTNFGTAISFMAAKYFAEEQAAGATGEEASEVAYTRVVDDMVLGANEDRFHEFLSELPGSEREAVRKIWFGLLRTAASNAEDDRD
jgi:hypothetical protein